MPDNKTNVLVPDINNKCDMSTFLEDGKIMVKIASRFLLFHSNGSFIDQIEFKEMREER